MLNRFQWGLWLTPAREETMIEFTSPDKKLLKIKRSERVDTTVPSPCTDVCQYTEYKADHTHDSVALVKEKLCKGCLRNKEELINWWAWGPERKLQALADIESRRKWISQLV